MIIHFSLCQCGCIEHTYWSGVGLSREQLYNLGLASILHDIGKIFIDKDILNKPDALTESEYAIIQKTF